MLGRWTSDETEAGAEANWFRLDVDPHLEKLGSFDPILELQDDIPASDPCLLFFDLELSLNSVSLKNPRS